MLPDRLRVCLAWLPSIEVACFDRDGPSIDAEVFSAEDEEGGDMYLRLRGVLGAKRLPDVFANAVSFIAVTRFVPGITSLIGDDRSSSE